MGFHVRVCKQKRGKFRFSSPRAHIETGVPPLWPPELGEFSGIGMTSFGVLLKFYVSAPLVSTSDFVCPNECWMRVSNFSMLWAPKLDSVGGSYNGQLSHLQWVPASVREHEGRMSICVKCNNSNTTRTHKGEGACKPDHVTWGGEVGAAYSVFTLLTRYVHFMTFLYESCHI